MLPTFDTWSALAIVALVGIALAGIWAIVPRLNHLPRGAPRPIQIHRALELADVRPGELVCDLNAGDGRGLVIVARDFGARAVGWQVEPLRRVAARLRALLARVLRRVVVHSGAPDTANLRDADVVLLYLTPTLIERIQPVLAQQLAPGARVVSLFFDLPGWQPAYVMPPQPGSIKNYLRHLGTLDSPGQTG